MSDYQRLQALQESDPEQFARLMLSLDKLTLKPHEGQRVVLDSKARFKVMNCGRRWGKTKLAAHCIVKESRKPDQMLWWVAPTYKIVKRGYAEVLRQLPKGILTNSPPPDSHFDAGRSVILRFKNGSRMEFYSAERPEGMLGEGVDFVVIDEAARLKMNIWNETIRPTLMDRQGGALIISTPRSRNWFYQTWLQGQDGKHPDFQSWTFPSSTNPTLPAGEVEEMRKTMPRLEFEQEVLAKFVAAGSSVFLWDSIIEQPNRIKPSGLVDGVPPEGHVVLGVDLARTTDFTVFYGARMNDRRNCYFERLQTVSWPEQKRRLRRAVRLLRKAGAENVMLIVDSTGVGDPVFEDLEAEGMDVIGINFSGGRKENMVRLLAKDLEERQAFLLSDGEAQIDEFRNYTMDVTPGGRFTYSAPEGQHDDVVSAKMLQHHGIINEGFGEVLVLNPDGEPADPNDDSDPSGPDDEGDDYSDLVDDDLSDEEAMEAVGLSVQTRRPTTRELLVNPDLWG